jgi:uncharacterized protein YkwD
MTPNPGLRGVLFGSALALLAALVLAAPTPAAAGSCPRQNATPGSTSAERAEHSVFCLLNKQRAKRGIPELGRRRDLDKPSLEHSQLMVREKCFAHVCPGEPDLGDRLKDYLSKEGGSYGENIAYGTGSFGTPRSIVTSWMHSKGHRANILSRGFEHIGIGIVWGSPSEGVPGSDAGTYTTDFGAHAR